MNPDSWRRAVDAYRRAVELDPSFAAAWAGVAAAEGFASDYVASLDELRAGKKSALDAAQKAIDLAPDLADGYAMRAWLRSTWRWDWAGAAADYRRALELEPANSRAVRGYADLLGEQGQMAEAIVTMRKAVEFDPLSALTLTELGQYLIIDGKMTEAREQLNRALSISPEASFAHYSLGILELMSGHAKEALEHFQGAGEAFKQAGIAMAEHTLGHAKESQHALDELIEKYGHESAYQIAEAYAWRGERDKAFEWLDRAFAQDDGGLADVKTDPSLASLRSDPRYPAIVKKVGLSP